MNEEVILSQQGPVATVRLNRPEVHNALTPGMISRLGAIFAGLADEPALRVVVLTGAGRSFCAGADLGTMRAAAEVDFAANLADAEKIYALMLAIDRCPLPVLARVNGAAIGGGVGLVCACDISVAVERAVFSLSETRLGLVPAVISPFVVGRIGPAAARELFLTGERFNAPRALDLSLVNHIVPDEAALDARIAERIDQLLQAAPGAQAVAKALIDQVAFQPRESLRDLTTRTIAERRASAEGREGMSAFLEKRRPWWQSRPD